MTTSFYWVRHGPTHAKVAVGWMDLPADLSDTAALDRLDAYLPDEAVVVSSDLSRARTTADAIQSRRARLPHTPDLREMNYGDWDGKAFSDIAKLDPVTSQAFWSDPGDVAPPGGESWNALAARVGSGIDALATAHAGKSLVLVAHFGVILTALQKASAMPAKSVFSFKVDNLSVTRLDHIPDQNAWRVMEVNHRP